jgi:hypothetical protein
MLTASSNYVNAINSSNRVYDIIVKVYRNTSGSANPAIDISDRVTSYNTTYDFESRSGRIDLEIDNFDYQLSPLNRNSPYNLVSGEYDPLFDSNHKVELYEGVLANGTFEYVLKFTGYMGDDITVSSEPTIALSCRDKSKLLQDIYIYQGPSYSLYLVEDVIQDLIDTFAPSLGISLQVLNPTNYMIGRPDSPYAPKDTNLWDAIQTLADSASMELRFMEDGSLVIRQIIRDFSNVTPNLTLDSSNLISDDMRISDADVRNYIVVKVENFDPITKVDNESIAKYGLRYMEVQRSMSDMITDVSQAHQLAENILRDLRFAYPNETAEIPFHPLVQVGDIVQITNPRLGTNPTDDIFKVVTVSNQYSKDRKRTRLTLQGYDKFISSPDIAPKAPTGLGYQMQVRTILNYSGSGWSGYEKITSFPMLTWTPPTQDISGNTLDTNFGGYIIERASQLDNSGNVGSNYNWATISSIPSYLSSLNISINYFYDYTAPALVTKYKSKVPSATSVPIQYRVTAIGRKGAKSPVAGPITVNVPVDKFKDINGNYI